MHKDSHPLSEVFFALCKESDTPVSLGLWLRYKYSEHEQLCNASIPIGDYLEKDVERFKRDYVCASVLSKYKGLDTGIDLELTALQKFAASEMKCLSTNRQLNAMRSSVLNPKLEAWIFRAKRKIAKLLGPVSLFCISPFFGWGPGATFDMSRRRAQVDRKMVTVPMTVSARALPLARSVIESDLHWSYSVLGTFPEGPWSLAPWCFEKTEACRVTTVPKSAKTDRTIAIEPTMNLFLQKGVGGYIRQCLKRRGVDLDNQEINQELAAYAYSLDLATIDLSAASDTVSKELVYELLPYDWADLLDSLRSHEALMPDGSTVILEKWSSMGNGYTFELESLIFWALASAVLEEIEPKGRVSVYGDDIIISRSAATQLIELLEFCGFSVNTDKSYIQGNFFESCGKHFFAGEDVTPCYQKELLDCPTENIRFHNRLIRWSERTGIPTMSQAPLYRHSPRDFQRCLLPFGVEGDDGFLVDLTFLVESSREFCENRGIRLRVVSSVPRSLPGIESALLALTLRKTASIDHPVDPYGFNRSVMDTQPYHGNIELPPEKTAWRSSLPRKTRESFFGKRWVIPPGYCPLPRT